MWHLRCDMRHLICDMWHVTHDGKWIFPSSPAFSHATCDMWHLTHGGRWIFFKHFRSLAPMQIHTSQVTEVTSVQPQQPGYIDNKIWKKIWVSESMSDKGVCKISPATPGCYLLTNSRFQQRSKSSTKEIWMSLGCCCLSQWSAQRSSQRSSQRFCLFSATGNNCLILL